MQCGSTFHLNENETKFRYYVNVKFDIDFLHSKRSKQFKDYPISNQQMRELKEEGRQQTKTYGISKLIVFHTKNTTKNNNNDGNDECSSFTSQIDVFWLAPCSMFICQLCIDTRLQFKLYIFFVFFLISCNLRRQFSHMKHVTIIIIIIICISCQWATSNITAHFNTIFCLVITCRMLSALHFLFL